MGLFLPAERYCSFRFMLLILRGEKLAYKSEDIRVVNVPKYKEIRAKNVLAAVLPNDGVASYIPDKVRGNFRCDESFTLSIIAK